MEKKCKWEDYVDGLCPICNECKTPLVQEYSYSDTFICPRCNTQRRCYQKDRDAAEVLILDNIKKNLYPKADNFMTGVKK